MGALFEEPAQHEARPPWQDVPEEIISRLQEILKEKIRHAETCWGGYSPTAVYTAALQSGKKVFIKGTHPGQDAHGVKMLQEEIDAYLNFGEIGNFSPAYLGCAGDGGEDGWMLAAFDHIDSLPTLPWTPDKIEKAFGLLSRLHRCQTGTLLPAREKNFVGKFLRAEGGWLRLQGEPETAGKFLSLFDNENDGREWLKKTLPALCEKQRQAPMTGGATGVIHQDPRSDNFLFGKSGGVYLVDWPNACVGPVVMDIAYFLSTISAESGLDANALLETYEKTAGARIDRDSLAIALAASSGYLADNAYRAIPPKLPRLRWMQKSTLRAMLCWMTVLTDSPLPPRFKGQLRG